MSYQALYRVWRPQTFDELVGQDVIARTLKNAVIHQQIGHAYLFTGPRGTGKTSAAKILAKAVNCLNPHDGNPCNECEICQLANQGQLSDVIEIDAASNNGVEEIRDLRDKVRYAPTQAKNKVYIIDEVHMLTTGAFNALLKTLEEPPAQVVFILATTEPHKIPATIISRTQRFDFQRIQDVNLIQRMEEILAADAISYEAEALAIIARASNGGMRDSLSLLDQALSFNRQEVTSHTALSVSGSLSQEVFIDYLLALYRQEAEAALTLTQAEMDAGKQANRFIEELILFCRDVLLSTYIGKNQTLLTQTELEKLTQVIEPSFYYDLIDQLTQAQSQMRLSNQPNLYLEVVTLQMARHQGGQETEAKGIASQETSVPLAAFQEVQGQLASLQAELRQVQQSLQGLEQAGPAPSSQPASPQASAPSPPKRTPRPRPQNLAADYHLDRIGIYRVLNEATHQHIQQMKGQWVKILNLLSPQDRAYFQSSQPLAAGPSRLLVEFDRAEYCAMVQDQVKLQESLINQIYNLTGFRPKLALVLAGDWPEIRSQYAKERKANGNEPLDLPEEVAEEAAEEVKAAAEPDVQVAAKSDVPTEAVSDGQEAVEVEEPPAPTIPPLSEHLEAATQKLPPRPQGDEGATAEETEEESPPNPLVDKAIELFGADNVNIIED